MKIVRLVSELRFGGIEKVVELASLELNTRKNIELSVVVLSKGGVTSEFIKNRGVHVIVLNKRCRIPNLSLIHDLVRILATSKPDVIHTSGAEANFHGLLAGFLSGVKVRIGEEIGFPNHHIIWELVFKFVYSLSAKVIVISKAVQQFIVRKGEVKPTKTVVIYNPVQVFNTLKSISKFPGFTFITVARLVPIKNLETLLHSFSAVDANNKSLLIIGDGPSKESLIQLSVELGIDSQVVFTGFQEEVYPFLHKADCFVLPSYSEGSSVALAEAMMAQLPSIVTKIGGASEILGRSGSGILIDPFSLMEIRKAMEYMINMEPGRRLKLGIKAREYAMNNFSPSKHVDSLVSLYKSLLNG